MARRKIPPTADVTGFNCSKSFPGEAMSLPLPVEGNQFFALPLEKEGQRAGKRSMALKRTRLDILGRDVIVDLKILLALRNIILYIAVR